MELSIGCAVRFKLEFQFNVIFNCYKQQKRNDNFLEIYNKKRDKSDRQQSRNKQIGEFVCQSDMFGEKSGERGTKQTVDASTVNPRVFNR
jgi:hypothetical protein